MHTRFNSLLNMVLNTVCDGQIGGVIVRIEVTVRAYNCSWLGIGIAVTLNMPGYVNCRRSNCSQLNGLFRK